MKNELDTVQKALIKFFKKNNGEEQLTLREIAHYIGVSHPQTVLNKLNQLVLKGYFYKDSNGYRLVREEKNNSLYDIIQLPIYGFAQCGNKGKFLLNEYSQEKITVTTSLLGLKDTNNCFFVRAKGNSMEPKIKDGDLVLIKQQKYYDENNYVFVIHNQLPKLKKIIKKNNKYYLESVNRFFENVEISEYDDTNIIGTVKKIIKDI